MRAAGNAILFGTDSFWTGVDVPGDALSQVVITRLPFDVPTHPVAQARAEWIREHDGNPRAGQRAHLVLKRRQAHFEHRVARGLLRKSRRSREKN